MNINQIKRSIVLLTMAFLLLSFSSDPEKNWEDYLQSLNEWKVERVENLKKPMGYLSMIGLYWLQDGTYSIGSEEGNDIIFPPELPGEIGEITLMQGKLTYSSKNKNVTMDGMPSNDKRINSDADGEATMFNWGSHFWYVIKRGEQYGIRMKDTLAEARLNMTQIPMFDPSSKWVVKGKLSASKEDSKISITNKVGITYDSDLAGTVSFNLNGRDHDLIATKSGDRMFIVFADLTNGTKTYGGGRFLYADFPQEGNEVILDFNKAENPICGFSDFATCPLPRPENYLPFEVTAGEKRVR